MSSWKISVSPETDDAELPQWLNGYVVVMNYLEKSGIWEEVPQRLRVNRQGYQGVDLAMVLLAHWMCPRDWGLKTFLEETEAYGDQLAAVAGRSRWPTQSTMSRALKAVDPTEVETFGEWILEQTARQGIELLEHSGACWRDSDGQRRRVFHADGMVEAIRQRALPEDDSLPPPKRFATGLAEPGYPGRKRGEVQYKATLAQETGTGLWVGATLASGNGCFSEAVSALTESAERWVRLLGEADERATVVTDGEAGGIGQTRVGAASELEFGTRLSCYQLLEESEVRDHLNETNWTRVDDAKSGPTRWAAEGGEIRLRDVRLRVVVSRYRVGEQSGNGVGEEIDGWRYELFGFDLDSTESISAAEAVTLYYGRNAEENRFAARNREFRSPEVVSGAPGGQYLAIVMSLVAWNLETILGSHSEEPLEEVTEEPETRDQPVRQLPALPDVAGSSNGTEGSSRSSPEVSFERLEELIEDYDWEERLEEGWAYDGETNEVICPRGERLTFGSARRVDEDRIEVRYRNSYSACSTCPMREQCSRSTQDRFRRELTIRLAVDPDTYDSPTSRFEWEAPSRDEPDGPTRETDQQPPQLVPVAFRRRFRMFTRELSIDVTVEPAETTERSPDYLATDAADRQRRRRSWAERLDWNALDGESTVAIETPNPSTAERVDRMLAPHPPPDESDAKTG